VLFQWGVGAHDVDMNQYLLTPAAERSEEDKAKVAGIAAKAKRQVLKDYVLFPALSGPFAPLVFAGNMVALTKVPGAAGLSWGEAFAAISSVPAEISGKGSCGKK